MSYRAPPPNWASATGYPYPRTNGGGTGPRSTEYPGTAPQSRSAKQGMPVPSRQVPELPSGLSHSTSVRDGTNRFARAPPPRPSPAHPADLKFDWPHGATLFGSGQSYLPVDGIGNTYALGVSAPFYGAEPGPVQRSGGVSRASTSTMASELDPYFGEYQKEYYRLTKERKVTNTAAVASRYPTPAPFRSPQTCQPVGASASNPSLTEAVRAANAVAGEREEGWPVSRDTDLDRQELCPSAPRNKRDSEYSHESFYFTKGETGVPLGLHLPTPERSRQGSPTRPKFHIPSPSQLKRSSMGSVPYQRLDGAAVAGEGEQGNSKRRRSFCDQPCCCPCCCCCSNAVGCGLCSLAVVLIVAAGALTLYLLFPGLPTVSVVGVQLDGDIFFGKAVTPLSLVSGGGGLVKQDPADRDATRVKLPLLINLDVRSRFRIPVAVGNITVTGFFPLSQAVPGVGSSVQIGYGGLRSPVTFPAQATERVTLSFTLNYDTADPTGASLLAVRDLLHACGVLQPEAQRPILLHYTVGVHLPFLSWTGFIPSFNSSTQFNCPWTPDQITQKVESLADIT